MLMEKVKSISVEIDIYKVKTNSTYQAHAACKCDSDEFTLAAHGDSEDSAFQRMLAKLDIAVTQMLPEYHRKQMTL